MNPDFVFIHTADGLTLPGLFYGASGSKKAIIRLHGNGNSSIFYPEDPQEEFAQVLTDAGFTYFPFNNRGANYVRRLTVHKQDGSSERKLYGMAYELIKDCVYDIEAATDFLEAKGYNEIYLLGHSSGANKVCV